MAEEPQVSTSESPSTELRWNGKILEQKWIIHTFTRMEKETTTDLKEEWRPVPTFSRR